MSDETRNREKKSFFTHASYTGCRFVVIDAVVLSNRLLLFLVLSLLWLSSLLLQHVFVAFVIDDAVEIVVFVRSVFTTERIVIV